MSNAKEGRKELDSGEFVDTGHWYNFILLQANLLPFLVVFDSTPQNQTS